MSSADSKNNFSVEKPVPKIDTKKEGNKQTKLKSNKYEKYCTSLKSKANASEETKSSIAKSNKGKENKISLQKCPTNDEYNEVCECLDEVTFISRNTGDLNQTSSKSNPFSANVQSISLQNTQNENTEYFGSRQNSQYNDGNSVNHELEAFAFKNETFDLQNLNQSSPNKNCLSEIDANSEEVKGELLKAAMNPKSELISVHDNYQVINSQPFGLDLEESRKRFDRLTDFSSNPKENTLSPVTIKMNVKSSLCNQLESSCAKDKAVLKSIENLCSRSSSVDRG